MICTRCQKQPNSHSFQNLGKTSSGKEIWYSRPYLSVEKKFTEESINNYLAHMDEASKNPWIWIFDATGLESAEMPNPLLVRKFYLTMEARYKGVLERLYILNMNWKVAAILKMIYPFLKKEAREMITICSDPLMMLGEGIPVHIVQQVRQKT